jgi:hypothetical protein
MLRMTEKDARQLAHDLSKREFVKAKVGRHTTNGVVRHVVHVTHEEFMPDRKEPYTIS